MSQPRAVLSLQSHLPSTGNPPAVTSPCQGQLHGLEKKVVSKYFTMSTPGATPYCSLPGGCTEQPIWIGHTRQRGISMRDQSGRLDAQKRHAFGLHSIARLATETRREGMVFQSILTDHKSSPCITDLIQA